MEQTEGASMSRAAAHTLLNAAKAGMPVSSTDILRALQATGDLEPGPIKFQEISEGAYALPMEEPFSIEKMRALAAWGRAGQSSATFVCVHCDSKKPLLGRRLKRGHYVCAECAA
jgi:hypothetical protein